MSVRSQAERKKLESDEAIHGIPGRRKIEEGDLVKLDVTAENGGFAADAAVTVRAGKNFSGRGSARKMRGKRLPAGEQSSAAWGRAVEREAASSQLFRSALPRQIKGRVGHHPEADCFRRKIKTADVSTPSGLLTVGRFC